MLLPLKLALIFSYLAISEELCPPERFIYGNSCYEFVEDPVTSNWSYAVNQCSSKGGQLVSLETEDEHTAIVQGLTESYLTYKQLFIGLIYPSDGGDAEWLSGAPLTYDRYGENDSNFKCTSIFAFHSVWYGSPCDPDIPNVDGYICEYSREIILPATVTVDTLSTNTVFMTSDYSYDGSEMEENESKTSIASSLSIVFARFVVLIIFILILLFRLGKLQCRHIDKPKDNSDGVAPTVYETSTPYNQGQYQTIDTANTTDPCETGPTDSNYEIPIVSASNPHHEYRNVCSNEDTDDTVYPTENNTLHRYVNIRTNDKIVGPDHSNKIRDEQDYYLELI